MSSIISEEKLELFPGRSLHVAMFRGVTPSRANCLVESYLPSKGVGSKRKADAVDSAAAEASDTTVPPPLPQVRYVVHSIFLSGFKVNMYCSAKESKKILAAASTLLSLTIHKRVAADQLPSNLTPRPSIESISPGCVSWLWWTRT